MRKPIANESGGGRNTGRHRTAQCVAEPVTRRRQPACRTPTTAIAQPTSGWASITAYSVNSEPTTSLCSTQPTVSGSFGHPVGEPVGGPHHHDGENHHAERHVDRRGRRIEARDDYGGVSLGVRLPSRIPAEPCQGRRGHRLLREQRQRPGTVKSGSPRTRPDPGHRAVLALGRSPRHGRHTRCCAQPCASLRIRRGHAMAYRDAEPSGVP